MYWIGLIVGILVTIIVEFALFKLAMYYVDMNWKDFDKLVDTNKAALDNRESTVQVYHDGECVFEAVFEEEE